MAERRALLRYIPLDSFLHSLTGTTKLVMLLAASGATMVGFDTRFLVATAVISLILWKISRVPLRELSVILWFIFIFMLLNNIMIFLFAPGYGSEIYGTTHVLMQGWGRYSLTAEQLFYQLNVTLKYFVVLPIALLFIATTSPSEFASSLNSIGVPYRAAYAVSLTLRYIPDVQRDYREISQAQQARGIDTSRNATFGQRVRNISAILIPLLLASLERIETISTAMELRGFGKHRRRSWYATRPMRMRDWVTIALSLTFFATAIALLYVNGGRFYNPFAS